MNAPAWFPLTLSQSYIVNRPEPIATCLVDAKLNAGMLAVEMAPLPFVEKNCLMRLPNM